MPLVLKPGSASRGRRYASSSWYPQVIGTEVGTGTDRLAGKRARFFMTGRSERFIEFER